MCVCVRGCVRAFGCATQGISKNAYAEGYLHIIYVLNRRKSRATQNKHIVNVTLRKHSPIMTGVLSLIADLQLAA